MVADVAVEKIYPVCCWRSKFSMVRAYVLYIGRYSFSVNSITDTCVTRCKLYCMYYSTLSTFGCHNIFHLNLHKHRFQTGIYMYILAPTPHVPTNPNVCMHAIKFISRFPGYKFVQIHIYTPINTHSSHFSLFQ